MSSNSKTVYWDSCVTLAWLNADAGEDRMSGIIECLKEADSGRLVIVTSEFLFDCEILDARMDENSRKLLASVVGARRFQLLSYARRTQRIVKEIRNYYAARFEKVPDLADTWHLANAIHWKVDEFHTLDIGKKGGRSLLSLDGDVAGYKLRIVEPQPPPQRRFEF